MLQEHVKDTICIGVGFQKNWVFCPPPPPFLPILSMDVSQGLFLTVCWSDKPERTCKHWGWRAAPQRKFFIRLSLFSWLTCLPKSQILHEKLLLGDCGWGCPQWISLLHNCVWRWTKLLGSVWNYDSLAQLFLESAVFYASRWDFLFFLHRVEKCG